MSNQNNNRTYHTETVSSILIDTSNDKSQTQELILKHLVTDEQHKGNQRIILDEDVEFLHPSTKERLAVMEKIDVNEMLNRFRKRIHPKATDVTTKTYLNADDILSLHRKEEEIAQKTPEMLVAEQISKLYTG